MHLWVADSSNCSVVKVTLDGTPVARLGSYGSAEGQFSGPEGLALAGGMLYVADEGNHRVVALHADTLAWAFAFGERGSGEGELMNPVGLTALGGELYVRDTNNHRIQAFSLDGKFLRAFGGRGTAPGQFVRPTGMAAAAGGNLIFVAEAGSRRVQVLTPQGTPLQVVPLPTAGQLYGLCVDEERGTLYVADYEKHQVHVLHFQHSWSKAKQGGAAHIAQSPVTASDVPCVVGSPVDDCLYESLPWSRSD